MALFFDQDWFRARLEDAGRAPEDLAAAAGLTLPDLAAMWKDQMEVTATHVAAFADVLGADPRDVARHCGVSTPADEGPQETSLAALGRQVEVLLKRLDRLEAEVAVLKTQINEQDKTRT